MKFKLLIFTSVFFFLFLLVVLVPNFFGVRTLSDGEHAILEFIYQEGVDLDQIRIKEGGPLTLVYPGVTLGNTIAFPVGAYDEMDLRDQALLVHEVCHVWQYQHFGWGYIPRSLWELFTQHDTYVIHHDATKTFREYDVEEQCEIVAEYYLNQNDIYQSYIDEVRGESF